MFFRIRKPAKIPIHFKNKRRGFTLYGVDASCAYLKMWALGGASDAGISTKSSYAIFFYLITMKKVIFLAALVAAAVPASAQIAFQSEGIGFVPGDFTADNAAKVYTIENDDNVEVYDASLNRIKSFKMNLNKATQGAKKERCSNAENLTLTGCHLFDQWEYRYWNENNEEVVLTATSVDDMIAKLYFLQGQRTFYKITINGKAGAYHGRDFYYIGEDGKVFNSAWDVYSWESKIEFGNEDALVWETISEETSDVNGYAAELEYYNFDNSTNSADMDFEISQTLFNDDSKWEYVVKKFGPLETEYTDYRIDDFDNGRAIIYRTARYEASIAGYPIMNEDGAEVGFIANPEGGRYLSLYDVVVIGNKKYLRANGYDYYYLFDLDNLGSAALVVERKDNMRVVSQGDVVEIILPKNAANGEVGIVGMNGQTLGRQKVGDGQSRAKFNSANLAKGVYNATFTHKNGKRESQKFVVK